MLLESPVIFFDCFKYTGYNEFVKWEGWHLHVKSGSKEAVMDIPKHYYKTDTIYRSLTGIRRNGELVCGFMYKPDASYSDTYCFDYYGAFLLLDGCGYHMDQSGKKIPIYPGDFVQRIPDKPNGTQVIPDGRWLEFFISFGTDTFWNLVDVQLLSDQPVIHPGLSSLIFQKCTYLLKCMKTWPNDKQPQLYLNLQEFAIELYQRSLHKQMDPQTRMLMQKASELLCASPEFPSAQETAGKLGMNYETFRKKFKQYFRCSPASYQLTARINYSKTLLLNTGKTLNEIALLCHFSDAFAFSKAFKRYYGISPSYFRQMYL